LSSSNKIVMFTDWYAPGFKAGGPITSLVNLVNELEQECDIYIITSDRDLQDTEPYPNIKINTWIKKNHHNVFYCSIAKQNKTTYIKLLKEIQPNAVYVNGIYSLKFSILPLLALKQFPNIKTIVAPRGMLSSGALHIKSSKKKLFLLLAKMVGLYKNIQWHATSEQEEKDIQQKIGNNTKINLLKNLTHAPQNILFNNSDFSTLKLVSISRVSAIKNIHFLIEVLQSKTYSKPIVLDVFGMLEDDTYYKLCVNSIKQHPNTNVTINFKGEINPSDISETLANYHFGVYPTKNENFGHAIVESLSHGLPVIISDKTPWNSLQTFVLPLQQNLWKQCIEHCCAIDFDTWKILSSNASNYFLNTIYSVDDKKKYLSLFFTNA
jgi:glycosyltransferase involved in cell wall biosynthesis